MKLGFKKVAEPVAPPWGLTLDLGECLELLDCWLMVTNVGK